jgi:putative nucleotidyltransferase with HDIG domain
MHIDAAVMFDLFSAKTRLELFLIKHKNGRANMHAEAKVILGWVSDRSDSYGIPGCKKDFIIDTFKAGLQGGHMLTCLHEKRVTLLAERVAGKLGQDVKAASLGGMLHDTGKFVFSPNLINKRKINADEYETIRQHAKYSYIMLRDYLFFTSIIARTHHGETLKDPSGRLSESTKKKLSDICRIVSVADYIEAAFMRRDSILLDGSGAATLRESLLKKYPNEISVIDASLGCARELGWAVW